MKLLTSTATAFLAVVMILVTVPAATAMNGAEEADTTVGIMSAKISETKADIEERTQRLRNLQARAGDEGDRTKREALLAQADAQKKLIAEMNAYREEQERALKAQQQALRDGSRWWTSFHEDAVRNRESVVVVPSSVMKPENMHRIIEDMTVMRRVLQKSLEREFGSETHGAMRNRRLATGATGLFDSLADSGKAPDFYIQGFGALFMLEVDFPLAEPPEPKEEETTETPEEDSLWEQVKNEMRETPDPKFSYFESRTVPEESNDFDPDKVESLKKTLISALKHAANMKGIQPDEAIVISVSNAQSAANALNASSVVKRSDGMMMVKDSRGRVVFSGKAPESGTWVSSVPSLMATGLTMRTTTLTLRAKKADIDNFAAGRIDGEKFRSRVQILVNCADGGVVDGRKK